VTKTLDRRINKQATAAPNPAPIGFSTHDDKWCLVGLAGYASRSTDGVPGIDVAGVRVLLLTA